MGHAHLIAIGLAVAAAPWAAAQAGSSHCAALGPDALEPNDTCVLPRVILDDAVYTGLATFPGNSDFYSVFLPAQGQLDILVQTRSGAPRLRLLTASCAVVDTQVGSLQVVNGNQGTQTVLFEVFQDAATHPCAEYDLTIIRTPAGCVSSPPDAFEPNNTCASASPAASGVISFLTISSLERDFFSVRVRPGDVLEARIDFISAAGDLDLYLWDPAVGCGFDPSAPPGPQPGQVDADTGGANAHTVLFSNTTNIARDLVLEVVWADVEGCSEYDLVLTGAANQSPVGAPFCAPVANSTGVPGRLGAIGSPVALFNDLRLQLTDLPPQQFGIVVVAPGAGAGVTPPSSLGSLCLTGPIGRYSRPGEIFMAGPDGTASFPLDLRALRRPSAPVSVPVQPGDVWYFQAWHRDVVPGAPGSNFTEGVRVQFF